MTHSSRPTEEATRRPFGDPIVLVLSIGFIVAFLSLSLYDIERVASTISQGFAWTALTLGSYFQLLLLMTFLIAMGLALTPAAKARIGNLDAPEMGTFKWVSIILCALLGGGGVFFATGEPIYHFVVTPPLSIPTPALPRRWQVPWPSRLPTGGSWPGRYWARSQQ